MGFPMQNYFVLQKYLKHSWNNNNNENSKIIQLQPMQKLITLLLILPSILSFQFASLIINAASKVINTVTTYQVDFDRTQGDDFQTTAYLTTPITSTDTATVTFPSPFALSSVTCIISVNNGNQFSPACSVLGSNKVVINNIVIANTIVSKLTVWISNVLNPSPAITTDYFTGTIGSDTSGTGYFASNVILEPGSFSNCYSTFSPTTVNSTSNMIVTLTPNNQIPSNGYVVIELPEGRRWTNDISTTNFIPISTSMACSSRSPNVLSSLQCVGDINQVLVTVTNMFNTAASTSFSFSINNLLSPPTNQQSDVLTATSYASSGDKIDTCNFYVSDLTPKAINVMAISSSTGGSMTVNVFYTLRFIFTLTDTLAQTDTLTVVFPTGTVLNFNNLTVTTNFSNAVASATFQTASLTLYVSLTNQGRIFSTGTILVLTVGSYQAPNSIQPTSNFVLSILRNNFKKLQGTAKVTAVQSTITGSVSSIAISTVNANTSYTFQITTLDPISTTGRIKIICPSSISILGTSPSCATLSGTNTSTSPVCTYNSTENSITLSSLNSSSTNIGAQTLTITISGLKNPSSTAPSGTFNVITYFRNTDTSVVASGTIPSITATAAVIPNSRVSVTASTTIVNDVPVTYSFQYTVMQPIPTGGYFTIIIPSQVTIDIPSVSTSCSININSTSFVTTPCTAATVTGGVIVNFTNPFAIDATLNTVLLARISSVFTNPSCTRPTSTFKMHTYHSNGFEIAYIDNALTVQMITPANFNTITVSRSLNKNNDLTTYSFSINQKSAFQASSVIVITFPSNIIPSSSSLCALTSPSSSALTCTYSAQNMKITLPSSAYSSGTTLVITVSLVRNPPSFEPAGSFTVRSLTANQLYTYSLQTITPALSNNIPTTFQNIAYQFTPAVYGQSASLQINFTLTNSRLPAKMRLTLANSFTIGTIACISFVDFTGSCTTIAPNTIDVTGNFTNGAMAFSITGITTPITNPSDYSSLVTFDSGDYKIDQSTSTIIFGISCTLPCRTCASSTEKTKCTSCYSSTAITNFINYDSLLSNCYSTCPSGKYAQVLTLTCNPCDTNCLTCSNTATFCLSCNSSSNFKYLFTNTTVTPNTQTCLSVCPNRMYPDALNSNICTNCVSPCVTCTSASACTSCIAGRYLLGTACGTTCPSTLYIANPTTNICDPCDPNCLTCQVITTNCTSCTPSLLRYQYQCRTSCPSPLVPQNGTCGPCDSSCLTCDLTPTNCTSCNTSSTLAYFLNYKCLSVCPEGYYKNIGLGACSLCSAVTGLNCNNCSSVSTCFTCNVGFVLFNSTCLNYVPTGYVNISGVAQACLPDCATCSVTTSNCTSCQNYNLLNNVCYQVCPAGYIGISKICQPCISPCRTCSASTTSCTSCITTLTPSVYLSNNLCIQTCPDGTFASNSNYSCVSCVSPCQYCTSTASCLSCLNGFYLYATSCITDCPSGYAGVNRICRPCQGNCATCQNQTTLCTTCRNGTYLYQLNSSCLSSCGSGLYVDAVSNTCIFCTSPCKTCVNTSSTCLSCLTGVLYNNQCLNNCPAQYFNQSGTCQQCPTSCSACTSLTNCNSCANNYNLYNGFCVTDCPPTHAVVVAKVCTLCSGASCHECTSADVCTMCNSQFSLLNGACLSSCPSGYATNGTHCVDLTQQSLTTPTSFPVPFSIAATVFIIACLMSKLQYSRTFLPGAVFAFLGLLETGALGFFLYLYFTGFFTSQPFPFYIGVAALAYLILLNIFGCLIQNIIFCNDKQFKMWNSFTPTKCATFWVNLISLVINHKFRNILFCKLFTFTVFTSQLQSVSKFKVINIFSFLSLIHSGAAIFAVSIAISYSQKMSQLYYECIDVIVVTGLNAILAFFNVMKPHDFFYEMTPEGFELKKKINAQQIFHQSQNRIEPQGGEIQDQEGYSSNIYHNQGLTKSGLNTALISTTTKPFKSGTYKVEDISQIPDESYGSLVDPQIKLQDASMQALQIIDDRSFEDHNQSNRQFDLTAIPRAGHSKHEDASNYTTIFKYSDKGVGNTIDEISQKGIQNTIDHGPDVNDVSIQPSYVKMVDQSVQRYSSFDPVDKSIQRTVFFKQDQSIQYAQSMKSKPPSVCDQSISNIKASVKDKSIQQAKSVSNKSIMYKKSLKDQQIQKSTIEKIDQQVQNQPQQQEQQIQAVQLNSQKGNQKQVSGRQRSIQYTQSNRDKSIQHAGIGKFQQYTEEMPPSGKEKSDNIVIFEEVNMQQQSPRNKQLEQEKKDEFMLPKQQIKSYQQQLQQRIRDKQKELSKIKRKIQIQERKNNSKMNNEKSPMFIDETNRSLVKSKDQKISFSIQQSGANSNLNASKEQQGRINIVSGDQNQIGSANMKKNKGKIKDQLYENRDGKVLKKQMKQMQQFQEEMIDNDGQGTLEQIQVIDDINNRNRQIDATKITQQQFIGMLQQHPNQVIFENSSEANEDPTQINIKIQSKDYHKSNQDQTNKSDSNKILNIRQQRPESNKRKGAQYMESEAQISQGKDSSTKIYSQVRGFNHRRIASTSRHPRGNNQSGNISNLQQSQQPSQDPIIIQPINPFKPHSYSSMSQTIEQMHGTNNARPNLNQTSQSAASYLNNEQVRNKIKEILPKGLSVANSRLKKEIPADNDDRNANVSRRKFEHNSNASIINRNKSNSFNYNQNNNTRNQQQQDAGNRRSSFLFAGKTQFMDERLARKQTSKDSPLKTVKRWEYENEDRNVNESGGQEQIKNTRSHNINPIQTDKSALQFKVQGFQQSKPYKIAPRKQLIPDQISPFINQLGSKQPQKPRMKIVQPFEPSGQQSSYNIQQSSSHFHDNIMNLHSQSGEGQPYIQDEEDESTRYRNQLILGQMLNRPANAMNMGSNYRKRAKFNNSKEKDREYLNQTQKIYTQKLGNKRK